MPNHSNFRLRGIACYIALAISGGSVNAWADDSIQFDPRFLELKGDTKIDLGKFSKKGYVDAGKYNLRVFINNPPFLMNTTLTGTSLKTIQQKTMPA